MTVQFGGVRAWHAIMSDWRQLQVTNHDHDHAKEPLLRMLLGDKPPSNFKRLIVDNVLDVIVLNFLRVSNKPYNKSYTARGFSTPDRINSEWGGGGGNGCSCVASHECWNVTMTCVGVDTHALTTSYNPILYVHVEESFRGNITYR